MSLAKQYCRQYSTSYLQYGFISATNSNLQPMRLLCNKIFSNEAVKPSRLFQHLTKIDSDKASKNATFFQSLSNNFKKQKTVVMMFSNLSQKSDDRLLALHNLFLMIARKGKRHTIGEELISPSVKKVLDLILHHKMSSAVIISVSLSSLILWRWVDEMATDKEDRLYSVISNQNLVFKCR